MMNMGAFFLLLAVLILVGMYLVAPFMRRSRQVMDEHHEISALMAERDRVITSLQELDFDFNLGKIPAEDYPIQRSALLQKGAQILRRLDEIAPTATGRMDGQARIERSLAARDSDYAGESDGLSDEDLESMIAARRVERKERSAGFCPRCGKPVLVSDRFCSSCGKSLT